MTTRLLARALAVSMVVLAFASPARAQAPDPGRTAFEARCVACHGLDGSGGDKGPSIVDPQQPRAATRSSVREVLRTGIPDGGMPAFQLPEAEAEALAAYVEVLRAPARAHPVAGDAAAGERFFAGTGNCASCHMVRGKGGFLGPDLSNLAGVRRLSQIEQALREPGSVRPVGGSPSFRSVSVRMRDGRTLKGLARYESLFDLGLQELAGGFRSIPKSQIASMTAEPSIMPKVQASPEQLRDLMAYLTRLTLDRSPTTTIAGSGPLGPGLSFEQIVKPKPGEWPTYHGQLSGNRHSPLTQINTTNVKQLAPAWTFAVPSTPRALEMTPVVVDGLMYVTAVNQVWALDARTGRQVWYYGQPRTPNQVPTADAATGINRGVAVLGDRVFLQTDHAHVIALNRWSGQLLWEVQMGDYKEHYGSTSAPLVVNDLVIAGVSGGDEGIRGFVDAYRASTGEHVWRFYTVPAPGEPGSETWGGKAIEHPCAATWLTGTYDPDARLLYWPTGNPCPDYNGEERKGDNLYSNSVIALDPETGKLKWYFQFTPHDLHDWDSTETPLLADAQFGGRPRKLLLHGDRNGFFYVLDRLTGELLLAEPFVKNLTWAKGIAKDGRPILVPGQEPTPQGTLTCPAVSGATNWPSMSFDATSGLFYLLATESCGIYTRNSVWWIEGKSFYGGTTRRSPTDVSTKYLRAIDIQTGKIAWEVPGLGGGATGSGLMSTAGGLVFFGDATGGALVAADSKTGALLWHFNTATDWKAGPMTYAIDGKQYVAMAGGSTVTVFTLP